MHQEELDELEARVQGQQRRIQGSAPSVSPTQELTLKEILMQRSCDRCGIPVKNEFARLIIPEGRLFMHKACYEQSPQPPCNERQDYVRLGKTGRLMKKMTRVKPMACKQCKQPLSLKFVAISDGKSAADTEIAYYHEGCVPVQKLSVKQNTVSTLVQFVQRSTSTGEGLPRLMMRETPWVCPVVKERDPRNCFFCAQPLGAHFLSTSYEEKNVCYHEACTPEHAPWSKETGYLTTRVCMDGSISEEGSIVDFVQKPQTEKTLLPWEVEDARECEFCPQPILKGNLVRVLVQDKEYFMHECCYEQAHIAPAHKVELYTKNGDESKLLRKEDKPKTDADVSTGGSCYFCHRPLDHIFIQHDYSRRSIYCHVACAQLQKNSIRGLGDCHRGRGIIIDAVEKMPELCSSSDSETESEVNVLHQLSSYQFLCQEIARRQQEKRAALKESPPRKTKKNKRVPFLRTLEPKEALNLSPVLYNQPSNTTPVLEEKPVLFCNVCTQKIETDYLLVKYKEGSNCMAHETCWQNTTDSLEQKVSYHKKDNILCIYRYSGEGKLLNKTKVSTKEKTKQKPLAVKPVPTTCTEPVSLAKETQKEETKPVEYQPSWRQVDVSDYEKLKEETDKANLEKKKEKRRAKAAQKASKYVDLSTKSMPRNQTYSKAAQKKRDPVYTPQEASKAWQSVFAEPVEEEVKPMQLSLSVTEKKENPLVAAVLTATSQNQTIKSSSTGSLQDLSKKQPIKQSSPRSSLQKPGPVQSPLLCNTGNTPSEKKPALRADAREFVPSLSQTSCPVYCFSCQRLPATVLNFPCRHVTSCIHCYPYVRQCALCYLMR